MRAGTRQLYLHGPPSPFLSHSLGFLDLPLDYTTEAASRRDFLLTFDSLSIVYRLTLVYLMHSADACQKLSPLRSSDFWSHNMV